MVARTRSDRGYFHPLAGFRSVAFSLCVAIALAACNGEGSSGSSGSSNTTPNIPTSNQVGDTAPVISGTPATTVEAGQVYTFTPTASDSNGAVLKFSIANKPAWATFDATTGELNGMPASSDVGETASIEISVSDGTLSASLAPFIIQITAVPTPPAPPSPPTPNNPPTISGTPAASVTAGQAYTFTPTAADSDGDTLTFSIANKPTWASFSTATGQLSGTPGNSSVGTYANVTISVSDGKSTVSLPAFSITVQAAPSTITGTPATSVAAGSAYSFTPSTTDPSGGTLTFSIQNKPVWASFNTANGALTGTPTSAQVGAYANITISVSDGKSTASLAAFTVTVTAAPTSPAPTISGTPAASVVAGSAYSFTPSTTDPSGGTLTFSIQNKPAWASFNATNGALTGTPTSAQVGAYANITLSVSDGKSTASLAAFTVTVTAASAPPPPSAPTISGTPATSVVTGSAYSFKPSTTDPSGGTLTFSIQNKPTWATFDTTTGQLSGTAGNAGTYASIVISVTNGTTSVSLPTFTITVTPIVATGSATLSWTAPTQNTDGTAISGLAGYYIYYGTSASALSQTVQVANPGLLTYTVQGLAAGTWYFSVVAYTSGGAQSAASNPASIVIQ